MDWTEILLLIDLRTVTGFRLKYLEHFLSLYDKQTPTVQAMLMRASDPRFRIHTLRATRADPETLERENRDTCQLYRYYFFY